MSGLLDDFGAPADPSSGKGTAPRRRRGGTIAAVTTAVVLLGGGAIVADRIALSQAQQRIETEIAQRLGGQDVDVQIGSFPFLTQLAGERLTEVTATAQEVEVAGITFADVDLTAHGVPVRGEGVVSDVTATATVPTASLQTLLDTELAKHRVLADLPVVVRPAGDVVALDVDMSLFVFTVELNPLARGRAIDLELAAVRAGDLTFDPSSLGLDPALMETLTSLEVDLAGLPDGVTLTGVDVAAGGLLVSLSGSEVTLP